MLNICAQNKVPTAMAASTLSSLNASSLTFTWNAPTDTTACAYIYSVCLYQQRSAASCANLNAFATGISGLSGAHYSSQQYSTQLLDNHWPVLKILVVWCSHAFCKCGRCRFDTLPLENIQALLKYIHKINLRVNNCTVLVLKWLDLSWTQLSWADSQRTLLIARLWVPLRWVRAEIALDNGALRSARWHEQSGIVFLTVHIYNTVQTVLVSTTFSSLYLLNCLLLSPVMSPVLVVQATLISILS